MFILKYSSIFKIFGAIQWPWFSKALKHVNNFKFVSNPIDLNGTACVLQVTCA